MKTNNIASYSDSLVACMRQNPIWILLAEVRSAEAVMAVRNSISSGHHVISTIHADKASSIPMRMYALLEGSQDIEQYLSSIHRYVQIGIYVKGYYSKALGRFQREIMEICEFYVDENNAPRANMLYSKTLDGRVTLRNPTKKLLDYLAIGNVYFETDDVFGLGDAEEKIDSTGERDSSEDNLATKSTKPADAMIGAMQNGAIATPVPGATAQPVPATPVQTAVPVQQVPVQSAVSAVPVAGAPVATPQVAQQPVAPTGQSPLIQPMTTIQPRAMAPAGTQQRISIVPNNMNVPNNGTTGA
jgi:hypothetical protein